MKKFLLLSAFLMFGILLFGCTNQGTTPLQNSTQNSTQPAALTAQYGDNVTVDYTLRVDGQVLDTSLPDVAMSAGIYNANAGYQPLTFALLTNHGIIPGFVNGVVGMKVGESKNFSVAPIDGYGLSDPAKMASVPRYYNISRFQDVARSDLEKDNITIKAGEALPAAVGSLSIYNFTNDTVTLMFSMDVGQKFTQSGLPMEVVSVSNDTLLIRLDVVTGSTYNIADPTSGAVSLVKVASADNETVVLDENGPLAGKTLEFEVTLKALSR